MVNHQHHHLQAMTVVLLVALVALQEHFAGVAQRLVAVARSFVVVAQKLVADSRLVAVHNPVEHSLAVVHTLVEHSLAVAHTLVERSLVADTRLVAVHNLVAYQHFLYAKLVYLQNISLLPPDLSIRARAS